MIKNLLLIALIIALCSVNLKSQSVGINSNGSSPDNSAMLDVVSTDKGVLVPRVALVNSTNPIASPATGLLVYNSGGSIGANGFYYYNGAAWVALCGNTPDGSETKLTAGTNVSITGSGTTASPYSISTLQIMTQAQRNLLTPTEGQTVYNSTTHKPNFFNGTEWMNYDGTLARELAIGDLYQGGIIGYILLPGDPGYDANNVHGIIVASSDISTGIGWYNGGAWTLVGASGSAIGTGNSNTNTIVTAQGDGSYAAKLCYDLVLNSYNDWYLPSEFEMVKLYNSKTIIDSVANANGGSSFGGPYHWCSTEFADYGAIRINMSTGDHNSDVKSSTYKVRPVRSF